MPEPLPVMSPIPTPSRPRLDPIPVILPINPIPLVPPTHVIVIHSAPGALPFMKLTLIHIPIAVNLNPTPRTQPLLRFPPGADRPKHRQRRPVHNCPTLEPDREREGAWNPNPNRRQPWECQIKRQQKRSGECNRRQEIEHNRTARVRNQEVKEGKNQQEHNPDVASNTISQLLQPPQNPQTRRSRHRNNYINGRAPGFQPNKPKPQPPRFRGGQRRRRRTTTRKRANQRTQRRGLDQRSSRRVNQRPLRQHRVVVVVAEMVTNRRCCRRRC